MGDVNSWVGLNAGEEGAFYPFDLTPIGFPGEFIDHPFCGSLSRRADCPEPIRQKLFLFSNLAPRDNPPRPISPSGLVTTRTPTFTWEPSDWQAEFLLQVSGPAFLEEVLVGCPNGPCSASLPADLPDATYRWRVLERSNTGWIWSDYLEFTVSVACETASCPTCGNDACDPGECTLCTGDCTPTFTMSKTQAAVGENVTFTANAQRIDGLSALWDLGDGQHRAGPSIVYAYSSEGTFVVRLTATTRCGVTETATQVIVISGRIECRDKTCTPGLEDCSNCPDDCGSQPTFAMPADARVGQSITLQADTTKILADPPPLWDLGNGDHRAGNPLSYTYFIPGTYEIVLTATESTCLTTRTSSQRITIYPPPPVACDYCRPTSSCPPGYRELGSSDGCGMCCQECPPGGCPTQTCAAMGGDQCSDTEFCPAGFTSLGEATDCRTCCDAPPPPAPSCGEMLGEYCSQTAACPAGYTSLGASSDCVTCCDALDLPSCGAMGGNYCSQTDTCPSGYGALGASNDCATCCLCESTGCPAGSCGQQTDNCGDPLYCGDCCADPDTHDHYGECGRVDSCGHTHGSSTDCGCPDAPIVYDTCQDWVCDPQTWVDEFCGGGCSTSCDWCQDCWDVCDDSGCWQECGEPYECNCEERCEEPYVCGGHWEPPEPNCYWGAPYACNPHQCIP